MATKELETRENRELWDPFRDFPRWSDMVENLFSAIPMSRTMPMPKSWMPRVDIHEDAKNYIVTASLPGVKKEDVKIAVDNGTLIISGERKQEKEEHNKTCLRHETQYGYFQRSFLLPQNIHPEQIKAVHADGLLTVTLPKPEPAKSRGVSIKVE